MILIRKRKPCLYPDLH